MQELLCVCAGKPTKENSSSARCKCTALIRLLGTESGGWYVSKHRAGHTHTLTQTCQENSAWSSHRHINEDTKNSIRQLREKENNVDLGEMYKIIGSLFGRTENAVPCTDHIADIRKTMDAFHEIKAEDPGFVYTVQIDDELRVKTLSGPIIHAAFSTNGLAMRLPSTPPTDRACMERHSAYFFVSTTTSRPKCLPGC